MPIENYGKFEDMGIVNSRARNLGIVVNRVRRGENGSHHNHLVGPIVTALKHKSFPYFSSLSSSPHPPGSLHGTTTPPSLNPAYYLYKVRWRTLKSLLKLSNEPYLTQKGQKGNLNMIKN